MEHLVYPLMFLLAAQVSSTDVYKVVTPAGDVIYSDTQSDEAESLELNSNLVIAPLNSGQVTPSSANTGTGSKAQVNYQLSVLSPQPEQTVRDNLGQVVIRAEMSPKIIGRFKLHLNEREILQKTPIFQLENLDRGEYQFFIEYISSSGKILASTELQTFYLHKASALINAN